MKKIADILLSMLFIFSISAYAQQISDWVQIESENKEISFAVPDNFSFAFDKKGFSHSNPKDFREKYDYKNLRSLTAYENGVTMFFESYDVKNSQKALSYFLYDYPQSKYQKISFENISGLQIILDKSNYTSLYYFASEKNIYLIGFGARKPTGDTISKFLKTIKLNGKFVFEPNAERFKESDKILSIVNLPETPVEIVYNLTNRMPDKKKVSDKISDETKKPELESEKTFAIVLKPRPIYTDEARQKAEVGIVRFEVSFSENGRIKRIVINKDLRYGLTENAIKALKRLRFIPSESNNTPISSVKFIEYSFMVY